MGDNLPPNVGAEEISEKKKDCCVGVQDSERHESVQKEFLIKESQNGLDEPSFVTERLREIRRGQDLPPFSELMQSEEFVKNLSIQILMLINGASDSEHHEQKEDFVRMIWPEILKEMFRDYYK